MHLFWKRTQQPGKPVVQLAPVDDVASEQNESHFCVTPVTYVPSVARADMLEPATVAGSSAQIGVETVADLLADRRSRVPRGPLYWMWMASTPIFAFTLVVCLLNGEAKWVPICILALITIRLLSSQTELHRQERAALQNSHLDNRYLGALAEALEWPDRRVQNTAGLLLTQFLPRMRDGDADLFSEEQRTCLYRRLGTLPALSDPELALAILRVLPFIGTEAALPYVERLAFRPAFTGNGRKMRNAARATLALLERRVAGQRAMVSVAPTIQEPDALEMPGELPIMGELASTEAEREELAALATVVDREMREFEEELRRAPAPQMRRGYLFASWCIISPYFAVQAFLQFAEGNRLGGVLFAVVALLSTQLYRLAMTDDHKRLARRLAKIDDVRCVGRLAELLEWPDEHVRRIAMEALTRLLPQVNATDNVLRSPAQRGNLNRMLVLDNARHHTDFLVSILKALEQIGDVSSVPYVQRLANAQPVSSRERRVCDAARECLPYLKTRSELNRSSQTLLRASSATATGTDTLVRPVIVTTATDPEELVRASTGSDL